MKFCVCSVAATVLLCHSGSAFVPQPSFSRTSSTTARSMAVSKKDSYTVTLLPGDGIGPEITEATKEVLQALCKRFDFQLELKEALIGGAAIDAANDPFPPKTLEQCRNSDSVLLACIGGYKVSVSLYKRVNVNIRLIHILNLCFFATQWDSNPRELRPETGLLKMRKSMGLFANLRPAKALPQLIDASALKREVVEGVDLMVVRELTGDVYFGTPKGIDFVNGQKVGYNNMIYSESEIDRIARVAGECMSEYMLMMSLVAVMYVYIVTMSLFN